MFKGFLGFVMGPVGRTQLLAFLPPQGQNYGVKYHTKFIFNLTQSCLSIFFFKDERGEGRQQKQEELQSCSLWNKNHIHGKTR